MSNSTQPWIDMLPGVKRRIVADGVNVMVNEIALAKGSVVVRHQHMHEQVSVVHKGRLRFEFDDATVDAGVGEVVYIAAHRPHKVTALEESIAFDTFSPPREDFRGSTLDPAIYGRR